jgi:hypothetical protein
METGLRLLVLVPHRDARLPLRAWSASLFAAGLPGAWSFPWVAPLARLKRPTPYSPLPTIWGSSLSIELSDDFFMPAAGAVDCRISPLVLGAALVQSTAPDGLPAPPQVSFRAAALANMDCRFLPVDNGEGGYLFEWEIGPLHWLPKTAAFLR